MAVNKVTKSFQNIPAQETLTKTKDMNQAISVIQQRLLLQIWYIFMQFLPIQYPES